MNPDQLYLAVFFDRDGRLPTLAGVPLEALTTLVRTLVRAAGTTEAEVVFETVYDEQLLTLYAQSSDERHLIGHAYALN